MSRSSSDFRRVTPPSDTPTSSENRLPRRFSSSDSLSLRPRSDNADSSDRYQPSERAGSEWEGSEVSSSFHTARGNSPSSDVSQTVNRSPPNLSVRLEGSDEGSFHSARDNSPYSEVFQTPSRYPSHFSGLESAQWADGEASSSHPSQDEISNGSSHLNIQGLRREDDDSLQQIADRMRDLAIAFDELQSSLEDNHIQVEKAINEFHKKLIARFRGSNSRAATVQGEAPRTLSGATTRGDNSTIWLNAGAHPSPWTPLFNIIWTWGSCSSHRIADVIMRFRGGGIGHTATRYLDEWLKAHLHALEDESPALSNTDSACPRGLVKIRRGGSLDECEEDDDDLGEGPRSMMSDEEAGVYEVSGWGFTSLQHHMYIEDDV
ncbi:hypothetical protein BV25DRAFT_1912126 [Artomyces pyxidatus]|uniref:Uncharacterized protein n=1 Tax=Artomyces pyxidatus TaxID=48021 RepID=A0ACB8TGF2_9AGAM|nr:hypothetical protein BV25DRAFT_1912126 [Artomyces pyxidatus]